MRKVSIKVNFGIPGYAPGQVVRVAVDSEGTPLDATWRRRLRSAETETRKSCEIVKRTQKNPPEHAARREPEPEPEAGYSQVPVLKE